MLDVAIDDIVRLRKPHPCGSTDWRVVRLGADFLFTDKSWALEGHFPDAPKTDGILTPSPQGDGITVALCARRSSKATSWSQPPLSSSNRSRRTTPPAAS